MIPKNIKREDIISAMNEAKVSGIPSRRSSSKYLLKYENEFFPPKYVISLANRYVNKKILDLNSFSGGKESNNFLMNLGFEIVEIDSLDNKKKDRLKNQNVKKIDKKYELREQSSTDFPTKELLKLAELHQEIKEQYLIDRKKNEIQLKEKSKKEDIGKWLKSENLAKIKQEIAKVRKILKQVIRGNADLKINYKILKELYAISPSLHENWIFEGHFESCFHEIIKHRMGLNVYETATKMAIKKEKEALIKGITTHTLKITILLENLTSSTLSCSLLDDEVKISKNMIQDIKIIEDTFNEYTINEEEHIKESLLSLIPTIRGVVKKLLKSNKYEQLKSGNLVDSWLKYAPCSIYEGPIFRNKGEFNILEVLSSIPSLDQEKIREHIENYFEVETYPHIKY